MSKKFINIVFSILALCVLCSGIMFIPGVRLFSLRIIEHFLGRPINHPDVIMAKLLKYEVIFFISSFVLLVPFYFCIIKTKLDGDFKVSIIDSNLVTLLRQRKFYIAILGILFVCLFGLRQYWISNKSGFHEDNLWETGIVSKNKYGFTGANFEKGRCYTGKEIREASFWNEPSIGDTVKDLGCLWITGAGDHTSFFYYLYRLWFTGFKSIDINQCIHHGLKLNQLIFCFSFVFLINLVFLITKNFVLTLFLTALAFISPASINNGVLFRGYELQELMFIVGTTLIYVYLDSIFKRLNFCTKDGLKVSVICLGLFLSCDYYPLVYVSMLGLIILGMLLYQKEYNKCFYMGLLFLLAIVFCRIFYASYGMGLVTDRGKDALNQVSSGHQLRVFVKTISDTLYFIHTKFTHLAIIFISIGLNIYNCIKNKKCNFSIVIILLVTILWTNFILYIAPGKVLRYVMAIFPIYIMAFIPWTDETKIIKYCRYGIIGLAFVVTFTKTFPIKSNSKNMPNLVEKAYGGYDGEFYKDPSIPVVCNTGFYRLREIYANCNLDQNFYFVESEEECKTLGLDKYWYLYDTIETHFVEKLVVD